MAVSSLERVYKFSDAIVAVAVVLIVVMMIIPIPAGLLSFFLILNISLSLLVLLVSLFIQEPLDFSVFPTLILILTLFRLCLNISTTRLILLYADAGVVIEKFGTVVVGGNPVVGFIIFLILIIIQFIVITKGAERVSEVAARFTLDAMPGKQMSIDADINSGSITEQEAKNRRIKIQREADFYGSMDGASKFVRGDAIAALIIVVINILGGFIIGIVQMGMPFQDALYAYTLLTVGDGLVTQIPALLVSTASGIVVTRNGSANGFGVDIYKQLLGYPKALVITCGVLVLLALLGLPPLQIFIIAAGLGGGAYFLDRSTKKEKVEEVESERSRELEEMKKPENVMGLVQVDPLEIELGYNLIPMVDAKQGGDLLDRILVIRRQCALELGFVIPPVRVRDNVQIDPNTYLLKVKGSTVGTGKLMLGYYLAIGQEVKSQFEGIEAQDPTFGLPALWVAEQDKDDVEAAGFTAVEPVAVIATHLTEIVKKHAYEIISRQDVQNLLDHVKKTNSAVVRELEPDLLSLGEIQKVLSNLLREKVQIRDLTTILETLADYARYTKDTVILTEYVRQALGRQIVEDLLESDNKLYVLTFEPQLEQSLKEGLPQNEQTGALSLDPLKAQQILANLRSLMEKAIADGHQPVLLCAPVLRFYFLRMVERVLPMLVAISYNELQQDYQVESVGMISI
ncbi:MAG: flagellar biosynthesis protein FlhA [Syntrophaceticus sp.]|mgnify:CR=1 FL=1|nr:flagellar biosynthesis protein FlhA [Eubacteriales bacterium]MDD3314368.1 flagellar biosynthesis protein FlhA [Syntrophaceticus sp.]MDD4360272.1 flagellar biosynthesis protein FlhA [Syntrophaceticus sp.]